MSKELEGLFKEATNLFKEKKYDEARELLEVLVSSNYVPAIKMLKTTLIELGEDEKANEIEEEFKTVIESKDKQSESETIKTSTKDNETEDKKSNVNDHPLYGKQNKSSYSANDNYNNYQTPHKPIQSEKNVLFDPSNKVWLNIMLYTFIAFEFIVLIIALLVSMAEEDFLIFLVAVILIPIVHITVMLHLNRAFNIQYIKDYIENLRRNK